MSEFVSAAKTNVSIPPTSKAKSKDHNTNLWASNGPRFSFESLTVQPKLKVSRPGDPYEQDADRIAEQVMRMSPVVSVDSPITAMKEELIGRKCSACAIKQENLRIGRNSHRATGLETTGKETNEINNIRSGSGSFLDANILRFMGSRFGYDFSNVKVHTDERAAKSADSFNALAYTVGNDIVFGKRNFQPTTFEGRRLLAHELTHVIQQTGSRPNQTLQSGLYSSAAPIHVLQRDLARPPVGAPDALVELTPEQIEEAIAFNESRFRDPYSILRIRDVLGIEPIGIVDEAMIRAIVQWQSDFHLTQDGKIGLTTFRTIIRELRAEAQRDDVIVLIIDFFNMPTQGLISIRFDSTVASNASTGGPIPGNSRVRVGPPAFAQDFAGLVHIIRHELEHVQQRRAGMVNQNLREFLAESVEILSVGMPPEGLVGFMSDATRARRFWRRLSAAEQRANFAQFERVRDEIRRRFNAASAADQATHQALMDWYNAEVRPP